MDHLVHIWQWVAGSLATLLIGMFILQYKQASSIGAELKKLKDELVTHIMSSSEKCGRLITIDDCKDCEVIKSITTARSKSWEAQIKENEGIWNFNNNHSHTGLAIDSRVVR